MAERQKAVVLLSGGLDSTTCLAVALHEGYDAYPISFDYNQRQKLELQSAARVLAHYGIAPERHKVIQLGRAITGSALTGDYDVPTGRSTDEMATDIPVTYVPARNLVFLAHATSYAEVLGATDVFIGVNALDYSGYPDCRPEFIAAFEQVARLGTKAGVQGRPFTIRTPLLHLSKAEIARLGTDLQAPLYLTLSCYQGTAPACGVCDACLLRKKGFAEAGLTDPIDYVR